MWKDSVTNNTEPQTTIHLVSATDQDWNESDLGQIHSNSLFMVTPRVVAIFSLCFIVYTSSCKIRAEQMFPYTTGCRPQWTTYWNELAKCLQKELIWGESGTFSSDERFWIKQIYDRAKRLTKPNLCRRSSPVITPLYQTQVTFEK